MARRRLGERIPLMSYPPRIVSTDVLPLLVPAGALSQLPLLATTTTVLSNDLPACTARIPSSSD